MTCEHCSPGRCDGTCGAAGYDQGRRESYIGDGVYASFDGYQIWLRVDRYGRNERVALEPRVMRELVRYANAVFNTAPAERKDDDAAERTP